MNGSGIAAAPLDLIAFPFSPEITFDIEIKKKRATCNQNDNKLDSIIWN
jgi:hypothetical protein